MLCNQQVSVQSVRALVSPRVWLQELLPISGMRRAGGGGDNLRIYHNTGAVTPVNTCAVGELLSTLVPLLTARWRHTARFHRGAVCLWSFLKKKINLKKKNPRAVSDVAC